MERFSFGVGVVIVVKKGEKILLGKRLVSVGYGQWGLPGGHLEPGESVFEAARRELMEETGLEIENLEFINVTNDPRENGEHWIHFVFLASGISGLPAITEPDKCEHWEWFFLSQLPEPLFYGHKKLLAGIIKKEVITD